MKITVAQIKRFSDQLEKKFPDISFAYLFGSSVSGNMSQSSDIDIAVYLEKNYDKIKLLPEIIGLAEKNFPGRIIDIIILNESGELIAFEALKGKILFIRKEAIDFHAGFYSLICRISEDHLVWMKRQLNYRGYEVQWGN